MWSFRSRAGHDLVDHPVAHERLARLEVLGELLPRGLLDELGSGEADERAGLRDDDVTEHRERGGHTAEGRVGEDRDVGESGIGVATGGSARLGHLHEREHALLHARAARCGHEHDGEPPRSGQLERAGDLLAHDRPHRRADEPEVHRSEHHRLRADLRGAGDDGLGQPALLGGGVQLRGVGLGGGELERVAGGEVGVDLGEGAFVGEQLDALRRGEVEVEAARGADAQRLHEFALVDGALAALALDPDAIGHVGAGGCRPAR